ncbi:MAG TPA: transglutaminase family protein [Vicinamibacterales bacterium]|jgi:transglutaminase-like putative cysteine protease
MRYTVRHVTRFAYETPITESVMETRMQPRSDGQQRCLHFALSTVPASRVMVYQDSEGNVVHHFNIPGRHARLMLTAHALVECAAPPEVPPALPAETWAELDAVATSGECWDLLAPSRFAETTHALFELARTIGLTRGADPLSTLRGLMAEMYARFEYSPQATRVDSRIDEALQARRGVCQDFSHIFIALARHLGIPTRYVSGYLFRDETAADRSSDGATHAWAEALMPGLGWVGFDPTNNVIAGERHIRVAIGRDYADVPPTRGVYKGVSEVRSDLSVAVRIGPVAPPDASDSVPFTPWMSRDVTSVPRDTDAEQQQQQ